MHPAASSAGVIRRFITPPRFIGVASVDPHFPGEPRIATMSRSRKKLSVVCTAKGVLTWYDGKQRRA
jgi:hypothetical protein